VPQGRHWTHLRLLGVAGEHDQVGLVRLQALDVGRQALEGPVLTAVVHADADGGGQLAGDTGLLRNMKTKR
jgi:hypothetical protein